MNATLSFYHHGVFMKRVTVEAKPDGTIEFPPIKADKVYVSYQEKKPMSKKSLAVPAVKIVQPEPPIPAEILATAISAIAASMKLISETRLTRRAIVALIADNSKLGKGTIEIVLNNLDQLESTWLKPAKKP